MDPYVSLECEGVTVKTAVKKDTESAKYEDGALFYVKKPNTSMLKVKVRIASPSAVLISSLHPPRDHLGKCPQARIVFVLEEGE